MSKYIAAIAIALSLPSPAFAKGKSRHQFDVCYLDHGKVAVVGTSDKQAKALAVASFLDESKADHGAMLLLCAGAAFFFVIIGIKMWRDP